MAQGLFTAILLFAIVLFPIGVAGWLVWHIRRRPEFEARWRAAQGHEQRLLQRRWLLMNWVGLAVVGLSLALPWLPILFSGNPAGVLALLISVGSTTAGSAVFATAIVGLEVNRWRRSVIEVSSTDPTGM